MTGGALWAAWAARLDEPAAASPARRYPAWPEARMIRGPRGPDASPGQGWRWPAAVGPVVLADYPPMATLPAHGVGCGTLVVMPAWCWLAAGDVGLAGELGAAFARHTRAMTLAARAAVGEALVAAGWRAAVDAYEALAGLPFPRFGPIRGRPVRFVAVTPRTLPGAVFDAEVSGLPPAPADW